MTAANPDDQTATTTTTATTPVTDAPPHRPELLMPAGSLSKLKTALLYGADAVYAGTPDLSLRNKSSLDLEELLEGVRFAHSLGKKIYLTLNLFTHNRDVEKLPQFIETIRKVRPDGLIVADPGVFQFVKEQAPELELHISTQANVVSWLTVDYWKKQGADLCVLAREVTFDELKDIRKRCPDIKIEVFVHGAMCMTYSGRCLLSNFLAERGANQGSCANSCRWKYQLKVKLPDGTFDTIEINEDNQSEFEFFLEEEFRPGELFPIEEDSQGSYILNSKDLCLMPELDHYLRSGVDSLKVEGRSKNEYYAAVVARAYRTAIDAYYDAPDSWAPDTYLDELYAIRSRGYTLGFHAGRPTELSHNYDSTKSLGVQGFAGFVRSWDGDDMIFELRTRLQAGDAIEFLLPGGLSSIRLRLYDFENATTGKVTEKLSAGEQRAIRIPASAFHNEDQAELKSTLHPFTVARQRLTLTVEELLSLQDNARALQADRGLIPLAALSETRSEKAKGLKHLRPEKAPKLGLSGCCGLGCNGCSMFWSDPKFERAREKLALQAPGRKLPRSGVDSQSAEPLA